MGHLGHRSKFYRVQDVVLTSNSNLGCHFGRAFPPKHQHPGFLVERTFGKIGILTNILISESAIRYPGAPFMGALCYKSVVCRTRVDPYRTQVASSRRFVCHLGLEDSEIRKSYLLFLCLKDVTHGHGTTPGRPFGAFRAPIKIL